MRGSLRQYGYIAACIASLLVFAGSLAAIMSYYRDTGTVIARTEEARTMYREENAFFDRSVTSRNLVIAMPTPSPAPFDPDSVTRLTLQDRFQPLLNVNNDTVGWLTIEGTSIDYPVVQAEDNAYYLRKDFERRDSVAGSIFMDYRNDIAQDDRHWIIYGHYMKDELMFKGLLKYRDEAYYREHPLITFDTLYGTQTWLIFSAYDTTTAEDYIRTIFDREEQYVSFVAGLKASSRYDTGIHVHAEDRVLTLSTCSRTMEDGRFTVHAKLVNVGDWG